MRGRCSKTPWTRRTLTRPDRGAAAAHRTSWCRTWGHAKAQEASALQPPRQDPLPGHRPRLPGEDRTPSFLGKSESLGVPQANRPPVKKGSEAGHPFRLRQAAREEPVPTALLRFLTFLVRCFRRDMHTMGLLPKAVTDSLTQQLDERGGGRGTLLSFTHFF